MIAEHTVNLEVKLDVEDPYPNYRFLRTEAPVAWSEQAQSWVVSRYDDIVRVLKDGRGFRQVQYSSYSKKFTTQHQSMNEFDDPAHRLMRSVYTDGGLFSLRSIRTRIGAELSRIANESVASLQEGRPFDCVEHFAPALGKMMATFFGLPLVTNSDFNWATSVVGEYPSASRSSCPGEQAFLRDAVESRKRRPGTDPISKFINTSTSKSVVDAGQMVQNLWIMSFEGGHTLMSMFGMALHAVTQVSPCEANRSFSEDDGAKRAVEELCRFAPPQHLVVRISTSDVNLAGVQIGKGEQVSLLLASGNRDESKWQDPDRLDLNRPSSPPILSFGIGSHTSPGSVFAKLVLETLIRAIFARFSEMRLEGEFERALSAQDGIPFCYIPTRLPLVAIT